MTLPVPAIAENLFTYGAPNLKFGPGASAEIGFDLAQYGVHRALVVTDSRIAATGLVHRIAEQMAELDIDAEVFDDVHIEPTDASLQRAIDSTREQGPFDAFVAVGGDPDLTLTQPPGVTASAGVDILCHALESYTAQPYTSYERKTPEQRVPYCGSNPIADMWAEKALALMSGSFRRAVSHGDDRDARTAMAMAATFAGMGFGNAGVHIPHANGYPIAGRVRDFHAKDYPSEEPMVPHGISVGLTAPEAFRFTFAAEPERHVRAAELLAPAADRPSDLADFLPNVLIDLMRDIDMPNGIGAVGYREADIPDLVAGTMQQQRLLGTCPRPVTEDDIGGIFQRSQELW